MLAQVLLGADLVAAAIMLFGSLTPAFAEPIYILSAAFALGLCFGISNITLLSVGPEIAGSEGRYKFNGQLLSMQAAATVVSGLTVGFVYAAGPITYHLIIAGFVFLFSGALTAVRARGIRIATSTTPKKRGRLLDIATAGFSLAVILMILGRGIEAFGSGVHNVGFPLLSAAFDPTSKARLAGFLLSAWGIGRIFSGFIVPKLLKHLSANTSKIAAFFFVANALTFVFFMAVFQLTSLPEILCFAALAGLFDAATEIAYYSYLQANTSELRDKLLSTSYILERLALFSGILLAGFMLGHFSLPAASALIYSASIFFIAVFAAFFLAVTRR
ncbi:hypothetical protein [Agrobacterium vitis]|uniref:hypothetical protein n=1 Tax=Agrobacterium vitis TaxID=373 RepID=UPI0012E8A2FB|nr:hypothetical protein [Agrobacterium vitis]MVA63657.1 hypothetical protein [Agrobacterium vitis]